MSRLGYSSLLTVCILLVCAVPARANAGLPMLFVVWPSSWFLLLVVIPLEAFVALRLLNIGWKKSLSVSFRANLSSTLVGIPATWLALVFCQVVLGGGKAYGLKSNWARIIAVTFQSPWLIPYYDDLHWMVPAAAAVLCVPFFLMSVMVEYRAVRSFRLTDDLSRIWRWAWIANSVSYGCIVFGLLVLFAIELKNSH